MAQRSVSAACGVTSADKGWNPLLTATRRLTVPGGILQANDAEPQAATNSTSDGAWPTRRPGTRGDEIISSQPEPVQHNMRHRNVVQAAGRDGQFYALSRPDRADVPVHCLRSD